MTSSSSTLLHRCATWGTRFDANAESPQEIVVDKGIAQLWTQRREVLCTRFAGNVTLDMLHEFIRRGDEVLAHRPRVITFHDWSALDSYPAESRHVLVEWTKTVGTRNPKVHLLFRSRLLAMSITVASLVLRNLHPFQDVDAFLAAHDACLADAEDG